MLFSNNKNLKEEIVEILMQEGVADGKKIHQILSSKELKYSIQAVYKQLKILLSSNVISKYKTKYKIHNEWRQKLIEKIDHFNLFLLPSNGEKITYNFTSPVHLEIFDKDITYGIYDKLPKSTLFVYTYHYVWPLLKKRKTSYKDFMQSHKNIGRYAFYNTACSDPLDLLTKKKLNNDFYKITKNNKLSYLRKNNLTMIIGPYIIRSTFTKKSMDFVDSIYKSSLSIKEQIIKLQDFFQKPQTCKTTIENNPKKASKMKRVVSKSFLLPETVKLELENESRNIKE